LILSIFNDRMFINSVTPSKAPPMMNGKSG
jgi:hypothetical protein